MKLHIGCGKKLLAGYLNCDVEPLKNVKLDAQFNVVDGIPFEDESVDEILMVHVWEHLYDWQHPGVTKECLRVLKPGCPLVLELPDAVKCCANLLALYTDAEATGWLGEHMEEARAKYVMPKRKAQHSYWGIFSDATEAGEQEHMMHHSGWHPERLEEFLLDHGFAEVEHDLPRHKGRRHLRDMRVVAWKG